MWNHNSYWVCVIKMAKRLSEITQKQLNGTNFPLERFILGEAKRGLSAGTVNHALTVINTIGNAASKRWRGPGGKPLLMQWASVPKINDKEAFSGNSFQFGNKGLPVSLFWIALDTPAPTKGMTCPFCRLSIRVLGNSCVSFKSCPLKYMRGVKLRKLSYPSLD